MATRTVRVRLEAGVGGYVAGMGRASAATQGFARTATAAAATASTRTTASLNAGATAAGVAGRRTGTRYATSLGSSIRAGSTAATRSVGSSLAATAGSAAVAGRTAGSRFSSGFSSRVASSSAGIAGGITSALRRTGAVAGLTAAAAFAAPFIGGIKSAINQQNAREVFSGLYGSAKKATDVMEGLRKVASSSPLDYSSYLKAGQALAYAGLKGKDAVSALTNVGKAITAAGGSEIQLQRAADVLLKMVNLGKVNLVTLNQLSNTGVPIISGLAKHFGKSFAEINKMASNGQIKLQDVLDVMQHGTGKTFQSMIKAGEKASTSFGNVFKRLKDNVVTSIGVGLVPVLDKLGPKVDAAGKSLARFMNQMQSGKGAGGEFAKNLRGILDAAKPLASLLGAGLGLAFTTLGHTIGLAAKALGPIVSGFNSLPGPLRTVAAGMAAAAIASRLFGSRIGGSLANLRLFAGGLRDLTRMNGAVVRSASGASMVMGRFGSAIHAIGQTRPTIARMQGAFVNAASGARRFARTAGIAAAAGAGIRSAGSGLVSFLGGPWGVAFATAGVALMAWQKHQAEAAAKAAALAAEVDDLTGSLDKNTGAITKNSREIVAKALIDSGAAKAARKMYISMSDLTDAAMGQPAALKKVNRSLDLFGRATGTGAGATAIFGKEVETVRDAIGGQNSAISQAVGKHKLLNEAMHESKPAASAYATAVKDAESAQKDAKKAADDLKQGIDGVNNAFLEGQASEDGFRAAIDDATKALKDNGKTLDSHTEKGRANREALRKIASSGLEWADSMAKQGQSAEKIAGQIRATRAAYVEQAMSMGASRKQAEGLARAFIQMPKKVTTKIEADVKVAKANLKAARTAVQDLGVDFDSLPPKVQTKIIAKGGKNATDQLAALGLVALNVPGKVDVKTNAPGVTVADGQLKHLTVTAVTANGKFVQIPVSTPQAAKALQSILNVDGAAVTANKKYVDIPTKALNAVQTKGLINSIDGAAVTANKKYVHIPTKALNTGQTLAAIQRVLDAAKDKTMHIITKYSSIGTPAAPPRGGRWASAGLAAGGVDMTHGGKVHGPGSTTSDSIPARLTSGPVALSNLEHVWTASDVAKAGGHGAMYALRAAVQAGRFRVPGYANGGAARAAKANASAPTPRIMVQSGTSGGDTKAPVFNINISGTDVNSGGDVARDMVRELRRLKVGVYA